MSLRQTKTIVVFLILSTAVSPLFLFSPGYAADAAIRNKELCSWVESWRLAWETADLENYLSFYTPDALQEKRNGLKAIRNQRRRLWKKAKPISVKLSGLKMYRHSEGVLLLFAQEYSGKGGFSDSGFKTLLVVRSTAADGKWRIAEESWFPRKPAFSYREITPAEEKTGGVGFAEAEASRQKKMLPVIGEEIKSTASTALLNQKEITVSGEKTIVPSAIALETQPTPSEKTVKQSRHFSSLTDALKLTPSVKFTQTYNDNVYFTVTDRKQDWISTLSPGMELASQSERMNAGLSVNFNGIYYADQHELNAVDQFYRGKLRYAITDRLALGTEAGYSQDSQANREIDTTGIVFPVAVNRENNNYGASGEWQATEKSLVALSYRYQNERYDKSTYTDSSSHAAAAGLIYLLSPVTKGRLNFDYTKYRVTNATVNSYMGSIGVSRDVNKLWSVLVDVGANYTQTSFVVDGITSATGEQTNTGWGPAGQITVAYKHESTNASFMMNKSVKPVSGAAGAVNRTSVGLDVRHKFTYELSGYLTANYFINKSDPGEFSNIVTDQNTIQVSLGPRYDFSRDMFLKASYTYARVDYKQTNTFADQHLVMLTFYIQHALFE